MTTPQISVQGYYYEITPQTTDDPERFNILNQKNEYTQDQRINPEIDKSQFNPKITVALLSDPKVQFNISKNNASIQEHFNYLMDQCEILQAIVDGSIAGQDYQKYKAEVDGLKSQLITIQKSDEYREINFITLNNTNKLQNQINQEIKQELKKVAQNVVKNKDDSQLSIQLGQSNKYITQAEKLVQLERRLKKIEQVLGSDQLTTLGKGHDLIMSYKGINILTNDNVLGKKNLNLNNSEQQGGTTPIPNPLPLRVLQHIELLDRSVELIKNTDKVQAQIDAIIEKTYIDDEPGAKQTIEDALKFGEQYEHEICAADEIPWIVHRLKSLSQIHDQSSQIPISLGEIQEDLSIFEASLIETNQMLQLLDKQIDENMKTTKSNISLLK